MRATWVLVVMLLAGCGGTTGPTGMFAGADHRFSGASDGPFEESATIVLPAGPHTLRVAAESPEGFGIQMTGPGGSRHGFVHSWDVDIGRLEYLIEDDVAGAWELQYGCAAACRYTIAIDEGAHLPVSPAPSFQDAADAFVAGSLDGDEREEQFEVPGRNVTLRTHVQSADRIEWVIRDGDGDRVTFWNFDGISARDWRYGPSDPEPAPGTWTVRVACEGPCTYNFGVIVRD